MPLRAFTALCLLPLLLACTATGPQAVPDTVADAKASGAGHDADTGAQSASDAAQAPGSPDETASGRRPLPDDSVYPLLAAEFALRQRDYATAMDLYMEQAATLRDPAVSAHAMRLAQYLRREDAAGEAARLWVELAPLEPEPHDMLATILVRQGQLLEAVPHLALVARQNESNARFPILLNGFDDLPRAQQEALDAALG
jgi:hypothetical protein